MFLGCDARPAEESSDSEVFIDESEYETLTSHGHDYCFQPEPADAQSKKDFCPKEGEQPNFYSLSIMPRYRKINRVIEILKGI